MATWNYRFLGFFKYIYIYKNPILNSKTNLQVLEHFHWKHSGLEFSFAGGKNEQLWWRGTKVAEKDGGLPFSCLRWMFLQCLHAPGRTLPVCSFNPYAYKRNVDHVNSQLSQPLKCLRTRVTNAWRCPLVRGHRPLLRNNYCILTSLLTWNSRAALILITYDIIVLIK